MDSTTQAPNSKIIILIAEDEEVNYMYMSVLLKTMSFNVFHADDGLKAVDFVKTLPHIDLILMDIKMPVMTGIEATKIIKLINPSIPIIATTAYALGGDKEQILEAGCDDYISKPIRSADLIALIKKYINITD